MESTDRYIIDQEIKKLEPRLTDSSFEYAQ